MSNFIKTKLEDSNRSKELDFRFIEMMKAVDNFNKEYNKTSVSQADYFSNEAPPEFDLEKGQDVFAEFTKIINRSNGADHKEVFRPLNPHRVW